jgi:hypothetical protein
MCRRSGVGLAVLCGSGYDHVADLPADAGAGPAEMRLEDLPDVHAARHAERVENDVDVACRLQGSGMSSIGTMREMTPLLPWRPAILSPG